MNIIGENRALSSASLPPMTEPFEILCKASLSHALDLVVIILLASHSTHDVNSTNRTMSPQYSTLAVRFRGRKRRTSSSTPCSALANPPPKTLSLHRIHQLQRATGQKGFLNWAAPPRCGHKPGRSLQPRPAHTRRKQTDTGPNYWAPLIHLSANSPR